MNPKISFSYNRCNFQILNDVFCGIDWDALIGRGDVADCFKIFKNTVFDLCKQHVPINVSQSYKRPWFSRELKRLKNLRNKFLKSIIYRMIRGIMNYILPTSISFIS